MERGYTYQDHGAASLKMGFFSISFARGITIMRSGVGTGLFGLARLGLDGMGNGIEKIWDRLVLVHMA